VNDNDRGTIAFDGLPEHLAYPNVRGTETSHVHRLRPKQPVACIEVQCPEVLLLQIGHLRHEQLGHIGRRAYHKTVLRGSKKHATAQLQRCLELCCLGLSQSLLIL
jgi:hypothetical protein